MGHGQVNAYNFLRTIAGENVGQPMTFPNVFIRLNTSKQYDPALYMAGTDFGAYVDDDSVATIAYEAGRIVITGVAEGQTKARITSGTVTQEFVITVRPTTGNGWL